MVWLNLVGSIKTDEAPLKFVFHEKNTAFSTSFDLNIHASTSVFSEVLSTFLRLAETRLSRKQKQILLLADEALQCENMSLNSLTEKISKELKMPFSTVKWNMNILRKARLIEGGRKDSKGLPAQLTLGGKLLVKYFRKIL